MARALAQAVILSDDIGKPVVFNIGDTPDKKYAKQITNPKAWGEDDGEDDEVDEELEDEPNVIIGGDDADDDGDDEDEAPAKSASKDAWVEYATSKGIELADDATKKDYQDAVAAL